MSNAFVWFHNHSEKPNESIAFYEQLLGWTPTDAPPGLTFFAGESGPFAGIGAKEGKLAGWIPYVKVDDVNAATRQAVKLGGEVLKDKARGPAGEFSIVRDPGGAAVALWKHR